MYWQLFIWQLAAFICFILLGGYLMLSRLFCVIIAERVSFHIEFAQQARPAC